MNRAKTFFFYLGTIMLLNIVVSFFVFISNKFIGNLPDILFILIKGAALGYIPFILASIVALQTTSNYEGKWDSDINFQAFSKAVNELDLGNFSDAKKQSVWRVLDTSWD